LRKIGGISFPVSCARKADRAPAVVEQKAKQAGEAKLNEILTELQEANPRLEGSAKQTS
jgi:hypothetical protein